VIVAADPIAIGECRRHRAVPLVRADAEVDRVIGVHHEDVGRVLGGLPIDWRKLREAGENGGLAPGGVIEPSIHGRESRGTRHFHVELARPAVIGDRTGRDVGLRQYRRGEEQEGDWEFHRGGEGLPY
jgi:hypothetical protein